MKNSTLSISITMRLIKFFTCWQIEDVANKTGFTKRRGGLNATTFLKALTVGAWGTHEVTLDSLAKNCCKAQPGLKLTKQSIFKRLETGAIFLKELLAMALTYAATSSLTTQTMGVLKQFKNVYVCDSTVLNLPDKLERIYKGLGGPNPKASLKIQVIFDLLQKRFKNMELCSARENDLSYNSAIVSNLHTGDLVIYDMGYFAIGNFKEVIAKGAHFLTRFKTNTHIREEVVKDKKYKQTSLHEILGRSCGLVDEWFFVGGKKKIRTGVRIVAMRLPENVVNERRRRVAQKAKKKGKSVKKADSELLAWNIIVTDVPEDKLSTSAVLELYRIRWQIELVFKSWKSYFNLGKVGQAGEAYFHCLLYGKLILITLLMTVYSCAYFILYHQKQRTLSLLKFFKTLREEAENLLKSISNVRTGFRLLSSVLEDVMIRSMREKRKRKTTEQVLNEFPIPAVVMQKVG